MLQATLPDIPRAFYRMAVFFNLPTKHILFSIEIQYVLYSELMRKTLILLRENCLSIEKNASYVL